MIDREVDRAPRAAGRCGVRVRCAMKPTGTVRRAVTASGTGPGCATNRRPGAAGRRFPGGGWCRGRVRPYRRGWTQTPSLVVRNRSVSAFDPVSWTRATRCRPIRNRASSLGAPTRRTGSPPAPVDPSPYPGDWTSSAAGKRRSAHPGQRGQPLPDAPPGGPLAGPGAASPAGPGVRPRGARRTPCRWPARRAAGCSAGSTGAGAAAARPDRGRAGRPSRAAAGRCARAGVGT